MSMFRTYFFDLKTRKEMVDHPLNGKQWLGTSGMVTGADGKFVEDTCTYVEVAAYASLRTMRDVKTVTLADFPGHDAVAVKVWYGPKSKPEWRKLVAAPVNAEVA